MKSHNSTEYRPCRGEVNSMEGALSEGYEFGVMTEEALENLNPGGRELRMASAVKTGS